jgi:hypothetical protein
MGQVSVERTNSVSPATGLWLALCVGILAWKLFLPGFIGMADNGDFGKVAGPLCLASAELERENFFNSLYVRSKANCFDAHVPSSERAIAWLASSLERTLGNPARFDIRWLGAIHALLFLGFYYSVLTLLRPLVRLARFTLSLLALWIFADIGLLAYFNSFYTDTAAALGGLAAAVLAVHLMAGKRIAAGALVLFGLAAILSVASKAQHGVLGPILAGFALVAGWHATGRRTRMAALGVAAALLAASIWIVASTPAWYKAQARFDLVFYKLTKNSPSQERDLAELGLDAEDARYIGMNSYVRGGPMENAAWVDRFSARCTNGRVLRFYLRHPVRALAILRADLAGQAWQRRVPGLANLARAPGREDGAIAESLGSWSALRTWAARKWPALILVWLVLSPAAAFWFGFRDVTVRRALAWTMPAVSLMALGEFAIGSLADAVETPRHLLMFHVYSDVSIFLGLVFGASVLDAACPAAWRRPAAMVVAACLAIFAAAVGKFEISAAAASVAPHSELPAGAVDDASPAMVYLGNWTAGSFGLAYGGTLTYSDQSGAVARFAFEGSELQYVYTKAPNRGMALVTIDGSSRGTLDLYAPQIVWQVRLLYSGFPCSIPLKSR